MAYAMDTLAYAKRLRDAGVPADQAEAHAEATREFVMAELVTRTDLDVARRELDTSIGSVRREVETMGLRLTIRLGSLIAVAVAILAAIIKL